MNQIIIIDENESHHRLLKKSFNELRYNDQKIQIHSVFSTSEAEKYLATHRLAPVLLLDMNIEISGGGVKLIDFVRNDMKNDITQFIVFANREDEKLQEDIMNKFQINFFLAKNGTGFSRLRSYLISSLRHFYTQIESQRKTLLLEITNRFSIEIGKSRSIEEFVGIVFNYIQFDPKISLVALFYDNKFIKCNVDDPSIKELITTWYTAWSDNGCPRPQHDNKHVFIQWREFLGYTFLLKGNDVCSFPNQLFESAKAIRNNIIGILTNEDMILTFGEILKNKDQLIYIHGSAGKSDNIVAKTETSHFEVCMQLKNLPMYFSTDFLIQINKSEFVSRRHIKGFIKEDYRTYRIVLSNDQTLNIGRTFLNRFFKTVDFDPKQLKNKVFFEINSNVADSCCVASPMAEI